MKRVFFTLIAAIGLSQLAFTQAYEGSIEYDKKKQDAFLIDYDYTAQAAENAITTKMEKLGYKPKEEKGLFNKDKGFLIYKSAFITELSATNNDYLFKVERKGRKSSDECIIYMIILKDGNNAKSGMTIEDVTKAKAFLNSLKPDVEAADLELQIIAQDEAISKAEKKLRGLKDDESDLEKKLSKNRKEQDDTQKDIENQKKNLEALKAKRVPVQ
ncbi:MAG: hypothetical protein IPH18_06265 [Chitinophagaceae bacterium]|nr:hypothetical protein [Chitinophagaceae bacterium]MBK8951222.1 hypothetical protein [Chitinophagaceae bacterium]